MKRQTYITPSAEVKELCLEGVICSSDDNMMELPNVTWKEETEW